MSPTKRVREDDMGEAKVNSYDLIEAKGRLFSCPVDNPELAFYAVGKYMEDKPELIITGTGHVYDFDEGVFYLHLFAE